MRHILAVLLLVASAWAAETTPISLNKAQAANTLPMGPSSGGAAVMTVRAPISNDWNAWGIPLLNASNTYSGNNTQYFGGTGAGSIQLHGDEGHYANLDLYNASATVDAHWGGNTVNPIRIEHGYGLGLNPPAANGNYQGMAITAVTAQKVELAYPYAMAWGGTDYADLDMRKMTKYNSISTVSNGIPSELGTIDTTGLTANVGATTLYSVPASGAGMYRVNAYVVETTAASVSSTLPNVQIVYTDKDSNTSVTLDATPIVGGAGIGQTGSLTANTVGTVSTGVVLLYVKASITIQYQTVNYLSTAAGMTYALHIKIEAL